MKYILSVTAIVMLFVSCKKFIGIPDNFDYGKIENNSYVNDYFEMSFPLNNGWEVLENKYVDSIRAEGLKQMVGDNAELEKIIQAGDIKTANLLSIAFTDSNQQQLYKPNISMIAENLRVVTNVDNARDYLEESKKFMIESGMQLQFLGDITKIQLGGKEFYKMSVINPINGVAIYQDFYATIINGFGVTLLSSWLDERQQEVIQYQIEQLQFKLGK